jgi:hypothetical protein
MERFVSDAEFDRRVAVADAESQQTELTGQINELKRHVRHLQSQLNQSNGMSRTTTEHSDASRSRPPDETLRHLENISISDWAELSDERLCKALAFSECISAKVRSAQEERIRRLRELEFKERDSKDALNFETTVCCICRDKSKTILLIPCRHLCLCDSCSQLEAISTCPICRSEISDRIRVYL